MIEKLHGPTARELYEKDISKIERLSEEQERELGQRILEHDDEKARNELVKAHLPFAISEAHKTWMRFNNRNKISREDLIQEANIGLMRAARDFDYRKAKFSTYAAWWMRNSMQLALLGEGLIRVPHSAQAALSTTLKASKILLEELKRPPTVRELAEKTELSENTIKNVLDVLQMSMTSLDTPLGKDEDSASVGDVIPSTNNLSPEQVDVARRELREARQRVSEMVNKISRVSTPTQIAFFRVMFGSDGMSQKKSIDEVAAITGTSRQNVDQKLTTVWRRLGYRDKIGWGKDPISQERNRIEILESLLEVVDSEKISSK